MHDTVRRRVPWLVWWCSENSWDSFLHALECRYFCANWTMVKNKYGVISAAAPAGSYKKSNVIQNYGIAYVVELYLRTEKRTCFNICTICFNWVIRFMKYFIF